MTGENDRIMAEAGDKTSLALFRPRRSTKSCAGVVMFAWRSCSCWATTYTGFTASSAVSARIPGGPAAPAIRRTAE
jgi:hypothetical protein